MAARLAPGDYDQLHHFIADRVWDAAPLESQLLIQADRLVGGKDAMLVITGRQLVWAVGILGRQKADFSDSWSGRPVSGTFRIYCRCRRKTCRLTPSGKMALDGVGSNSNEVWQHRRIFLTLMSID
jgi:DDE superfamily endonuclease